MSAGKFWILIALSLMIAGLIGLEVVGDIQVTKLTEVISIRQANLNRAQQQQAMLRQLLQRLAAASQTDPDVAGLLTKHGVHITVSRARGANGSAPSTAKGTAPSPDAPPATP